MSTIAHPVMTYFHTGGTVGPFDAGDIALLKKLIRLLATAVALQPAVEIILNGGHKAWRVAIIERLRVRLPMDLQNWYWTRRMAAFGEGIICPRRRSNRGYTIAHHTGQAVG